ncbi:hypothetical protein [Streptomyces wuyuanensis]|uniref:hypothetical protein n=1 Tax=Streptomyces wuyuanensis TaxID=1196353 RepID=UPI003432FC5F
MTGEDGDLWEAWLKLTAGTGLTISQRGRAFLKLMAERDDSAETPPRWAVPA